VGRADMAELDYEVLHKNVFYFPDAIQGIAEFMEVLEKTQCGAVTEWQTWYANGQEDGYPYGDLKVLNLNELKSETDPVIKANAEYIVNTLLGAMEACCREFMVQHKASSEELEELHNGMYNSGVYYGIRRYNESESMGPHPDRVEEGKDTYTISVYLDEDYEGGELGIVQEGVDALIKPKAGSMVVFPSGYLHESKPLTRGRKTIITHVHTTLNPIIDF
jgi:predicted 2-oxoglutarate/Fe(II)-dependent dioxygenase YbiX